MKNRLITSLAILILAAFGAVNASAQYDESQAPPPPQAQQGQASGQGVDISPGVARISLVQGDVSTQRGDSGEWAAAVLNAPIVTGDKVSTGDNARAEVQLDYANILRLGDRSQATIANITRDQIQVQIGQGIANYDVFKGSDADAEIDTPNVGIHPDRDGSSFRVIVNSNDETEVIVRRGNVQVSTPQGSTQVPPGQMITIRGTGNDTAYKIADAPPNDDWDSWVNERNNRIENAKSWNHTDRYYTGSEDLDAYGQWKTVPDYGAVWVPAQDPGWAPYRDGRWVWEPYYGWTWVPYEPWGWAPYHYGRWMYYDSAWAWWPGPVVGAPYYQPVWAPAYVSFFGFGGGVGVGVGFGFGSFGWLPLGPGDYCHPWWGGYRDRYNVVNITNVNIYNNRGGEWGGLAPLHRNGFSNVRLVGSNEHIRRGVSSIPAGSFGTGRVAARPVDSAVFRDGHMMTGNVPVVPSRESLSASNRPASLSTIRGGQEHFFGKNRPARVESFDRQQAQVQQSIQRDSRFTPVRSGETLSARNGTTAIRPSERDIPSVNSRGSNVKPSPVVRPQSNEGIRGGNSNPSNNGWTRFGSPQAQTRGNQNNPQENRGSQDSSGTRNNVPRPPQSQSEGSRSTGSDQSGWHRFSNSGSQRGNVGFNNSGSRNVPRPSNSPNSSGFGGRSTAVPRPPVSSSRGNSSGEYRSFGSSSRGAQPNYGGGESSRFPSRSAQPSYGGESNRFPSRGAQPNYGGGESSRAPSSRSAAPSYGGRGYSAPSYSEPSRGYSRPPLDMRQPIVGGRSSGSYGGSRSGGGTSSHGSSGSSHGGGSPHSRGRGR
jgi:hypothetical protein